MINFLEIASSTTVFAVRSLWWLVGFGFVADVRFPAVSQISIQRSNDLQINKQQYDDARKISSRFVHKILRFLQILIN